MLSLAPLRQFRDHLRRQSDPWGFFVHSGQRWARERFGAHPPDHELQLLAQINELGRSCVGLAPNEITARALLIRAQADAGRPIEELLPEAFALAREASQHERSQRPYDCQVHSGLIMAQGGIAEMATGEGKTLAAIFPAYLHALRGKGVHVATVNSYLAGRDQEFIAPILKRLGIRSALLVERSSAEQKRQAYAADVTYGVGSEFGFDYLRDQILLRQAGSPLLGQRLARELLGRSAPGPLLAQRGLNFAIIDEADSILIDEALTPLIISGASGKLSEAESLIYQLALETAAELQTGTDYVIDLKRRQAQLSEEGLERIHREQLQIPWDQLQRPWSSYVENALKATIFFSRDVHYIVAKEKVVLVDEFTGRAAEDRTWRDGLHQALECKERLPVSAENLSLGTISRQRFYGLYTQICGMTGTALESAGEIGRVYRVNVKPVPLHRPSKLEILPERAFGSREEKLKAAAQEIARRHRLGQPVLAGSRTIQESEALASCLEAIGLRFRLLNAKQDKEEADIIAQAGQAGAITIATNMAGRGAHIGLGPGVAELGGLYVLGLERHESRRVDRQLLGRSGRQGQPGVGQMYVSAEDHLLETFAPLQARALQTWPRQADGELPRGHAAIFDEVQADVEKSLCRQRLSLMERDRWVEQTKERLN